MLSRQNGGRVEALSPFYFAMLVLLAESKTMESSQLPVTQELFSNNSPVFEDMANALMQNIEDYTPLQLAEILGISNQLAIKAHNLAFDFPHKLSGYKALTGFTGEAFKGLQASSLSPEALMNAQNNLRIISSVYGILKPFDIIKPYRCEYNKPVAPGHLTPINYFKQKVTVHLVNYIKENKISDVIDLLPADADKCVDWKIVRAFSKVHKVVFKSFSQDGSLKTPLAKRLKELRGIMARSILMYNIKSFNELTDFSSDQFIFSPKDSKPLLPVFISD